MLRKFGKLLIILITVTIVISTILHIGLTMPAGDMQSWTLESTGFIAVFAGWRIIKIFKRKRH